MEILDLEQILYAVGSTWLAFGIIEYTWYLGLYRTYPDKYVTKSFQEDLKHKPVRSRAILLFSSILFGPIFVVKNLIGDPRPFVLSLT